MNDIAQRKAGILIVDDERPFAILMGRILRDAGHDVQIAHSAGEASAKCAELMPSVVVTDLKLPDRSGIELMKELKPRFPQLDFILITAFATVETAVQAMKEGAVDYLVKPLKDPGELKMAVDKVLERQQLLTANKGWQKQLAEGLPPEEVIFAGMSQLLSEIRQVATTGATILLLGESGTGKSLIARFIHNLSSLSGPFVALNCAAIPETLIESELFGHEKGAFTGAVKSKQGKFELANNGTIFLDEIGEMPFSILPKLLRVLQERQFERVGGVHTLKTDARIIAATNQNLMERIREKQFREDLYYRLSLFPIEIPPVRRRKAAMETIASYMLHAIGSKIGKKNLILSPEELKKLTDYSWPGNVMELHNVLERAAILCSDSAIAIPDLTGHDGQSVAHAQQTATAGRALQPAHPAETGTMSLDALGKEAIADALRQTGGHRKKAAELLGIFLRTLQYKIKAYEFS